MAEQLKFNIPEEICLITIRTQNSKLWFVNNKDLQEEILGYLAKYQNIYGAVFYAFVLMGNHYHLVAKFPKGNRHKFTKAFNRIFANCLKRHEKSYKGGHVWARRYRPQALPRPEDVKHWYFYTVCNPISSGLVESVYDYEGFSSFSMSLTGETKTYKLIDWEDYKNRKRYNKKLTLADCEQTYELSFSRLPGMEKLSQEEYKKDLLENYEKYQAEKVMQRKDLKKGFLGKKGLRKIKPGEIPLHTKTSSRHTKRPLVLTLCSSTHRTYVSGYFAKADLYREASIKYRAGKSNYRFPKGSFLPTCLNGKTRPFA